MPKTLSMGDVEQMDDGKEPVAFTRQELKNMLEEFNGHLTKAEKIRMKYEGKRADMTGQEEQEYVNTIQVADELRPRIEEAQKFLKLQGFGQDAMEILRSSGQSRNPLPMGAPLSGNDGGMKQSQDVHVKTYRDYLRGHRSAEEARNPLHKIVGGGDFAQMLEPFGVYKDFDRAGILKAYQADNPAGGGFAVMPQILVDQFITLMKDLVFMRGLATKFTVATADSLGVPVIDTDPSDSDWTNELNVGNEETTLSFSKREFRPSPLAKYIKESKKLLRLVPNVESVIMDRLAYKMAITEEKGFLIGTGANQPLGVFVADTNGIPTGRDITTATASTLVADDLINTKYNVKAQYQARAAWIVHRDTVRVIRKLKDSTSNYIWTSGQSNMSVIGTLDGLGPGGGLQATPERLLDRPVYISEYAPSAGTVSTALTTGVYPAVFGDFTKYWIADALDINIQVLYELFALNNQMGYILRKETDGMPVLSEAFSRLKVG